MVSSTHASNASSGTAYPLTSPYGLKAYGAPAPYAFKGLGNGSASGKKTLEDWWKNEWYPWFKEFIQGGGNVQEIDATLLDSAQWAAQQMGIAFNPWDPMSVSQGGDIENEGPQADVWGGYPGSKGDNLIYDGTEVTVGYDGTDWTHDVWGNEVTLYSDSPLVEWRIEESLDPRTNPPEKVLKAVAHNKETGKDTVYLIHGLEDLKHLTIQTPGGKKVSLTGNVPSLTNADGDGLVGVEEFKGESSKSGKEGLPVNSDHPEDAIPDDKDGATGTLTYNTTTKGEIHADYDDDWTTHEVTGPGPWVIHGASYADTYKVEYDAATMTWTIYAYKDGDPNVVETFVIHGNEDTEVIIDAMGENMLVNSSAEALDSVTIGVGNAESTEGSSGTGSKGAVSDMIQELLVETGKSEDQLLNALEDAGYPKFESIKDLEKAIKDGDFQFPPADGPDGKLLKLLMILDPEFHEKAMKAAEGSTDEGGVNVEVCSEANERLVELLDIIYGHKENISNNYDGKVDLYISFGGKNYQPIYPDMAEDGSIPFACWEGEWSEDTATYV